MSAMTQVSVKTVMGAVLALCVTVLMAGVIGGSAGLDAFRDPAHGHPVPHQAIGPDAARPFYG